MRRIKSRRRSKRAFTLVELIVTMTLTSIFAGSCVLLILPITKIYTHMNDLSRAQLLADTIVDELRAECANTYIEGRGDVWIASGMPGNAKPAIDSRDNGGTVLVIRRNRGYCETISSSYEIPGGADGAWNIISEGDEEFINGNFTSRAIYRMYDSSGNSLNSDVDSGYVHFGYYTRDTADVSGVDYVLPGDYYDFTNPFTGATYNSSKEGFTVELYFHWDGTEPSGAASYVLCDVRILRSDEVVYTRTAVLCFASPVN
ncbi:MAG: prepilin-type N-terminal cleavage/methylation domain-containing protein [Clostridiales bacterium]|nr:prepilin-type N-terminal cleavage/methylation domain-containing protein [Clostridiales bacterium]